MYPTQSFARRVLGLTPLCASGLTILTANAAAPVAYDDVIAGKADTQLVLDYLLLNDTDADGNALSITAVGTPAHGTLTALGVNSYRYTPTAGYAGRDSFTYTVSDGTGGTDTGLVTISVNAAYDIEAARTAILTGVTQLADPTQPSHMSVWGPTAVSISNYAGQNETQPMIAAATLGAGRVVVMPDHQWFNMDNYGGQFNTGTYYQNAINWAAGTTSKSIAIVTVNAACSTWLAAQGYTNVTTTTEANLPTALGPAKVLVGWLGNNTPAGSISAVSNFLSNGGSALLCDYSAGYSFWWNKQKCALEAVETYETTRDPDETVVVRDGSTEYIVSRYCPHAGEDLQHGGVAHDGVLRCLGHNFDFDLATGACLNARCDPLRVTRVETESARGTPSGLTESVGADTQTGP